jgi:hypothetical protein
MRTIICLHAQSGEIALQDQVQNLPFLYLARYNLVREISDPVISLAGWGRYNLFF